MVEKVELVARYLWLCKKHCDWRMHSEGELGLS